MHQRLIIPILLTILIALGFVSCASDEVQAEESLEGIWDIVAITSYYGAFSATGFTASETLTESGQMGTFEFVQDSVAYSFTRNETAYAGHVAWVLDLEKVRSGFSRENQFTMRIEDRFLFDVSFEDETRNAEKEARAVSFIEILESEVRLLVEMALEKR